MSYFRSLPLVMLLELAGSDSDALHELHSHRPVCSHTGERLLVGEYLNELRLSAQRDGWGEHAFQAYDLAVDRFCKTGAVFRSVVEAVGREQMSGLESEIFASELVGKLVRRHFYWCLKESARSSSRSRYVWTLSSGSLELLFPRTLAGHDRGRWLSAHIGDVDATRPGERDRVQSVIDELLGYGSVSLDEGVTVSSWDLPSVLSEKIDTEGLATVVAEEKASDLSALRPSIRSLGAVRVKELVLSIFEGLLSESYEEREVASRFGLSTAALSRFAGLRSSRLADLWANTASVIRADPTFREMVMSSEILPVSV